MADAETTVQECARSANDIGAEDIVVIDLRGISSIADYFVICTGTSMPHLKAIQRDIEKAVEAAISEIPIRKDGKADSIPQGNARRLQSRKPLVRCSPRFL